MSESFEHLFAAAAAEESGGSDDDEAPPCYLPDLVTNPGLRQQSSHPPPQTTPHAAPRSERLDDVDAPAHVAKDEDNVEEAATKFSRLRVCAEREVVAPEAPSQSSSAAGTSGFMAGSSGSPASASSVSGLDQSVDEIVENGSKDDDNNQQETNWMPGKRHPDEDDSSPSWRQHKKHFLILSNAGKPIYSRYGDENKLAGFSATIQAIISFVQNSGDCIHSIQAGNHQIVFLVKGPIFLVSICATDEPNQALHRQLELLHALTSSNQGRG